jgi:putative aminopeptidase FrvX
LKEDELTATGLDNRVGVVVNLLLIKEIEVKKGWKIIFLFTTQEENGGLGIRNYMQNPKRRKK